MQKQIINGRTTWFKNNNFFRKHGMPHNSDRFMISFRHLTIETTITTDFPAISRQNIKTNKLFIIYDNGKIYNKIVPR